jgi:hypothetical protein
MLAPFDDTKLGQERLPVPLDRLGERDRVVVGDWPTAVAVGRKAAFWCLLDRLGTVTQLLYRTSLQRESGGSEPATVGETGCLLVSIGQAG